ncbi:hypothetical protein NVV94_20615 [Pseudomonas sp. LS1212]|uniref:hypothetical protein n=1 Tax=Pseudomonas sp. LS1212 TaxID=2972478 RepID=UPI00215C3F29|nr:hypothetical protein [Pseudomonas sp. LS1212]UVJ46694.1 hypothetical protein NVV94_20615 [Pseudomonas sp. LS1212]
MSWPRFETVLEAADNTEPVWGCRGNERLVFRVSDNLQRCSDFLTEGSRTHFSGDCTVLKITADEAAYSYQANNLVIKEELAQFSQEMGDFVRGAEQSRGFMMKLIADGQAPKAPVIGYLHSDGDSRPVRTLNHAPLRQVAINRHTALPVLSPA